LPQQFTDWPDGVFLPWKDKSAGRLSMGLSVAILRGGVEAFVSISPALSSENELDQASIQELPRDEVSVGQMYLRLRTAEGRLGNYMHNFPGIFFSQRPDLSFSYIGPGLALLLDCDTAFLRRNGNRFLDLVFKSDRTAFLHELEEGSIKGESFSQTYRLKSPTNGGIVYVLDVRTPRLSPGGLLLGYEGVWLDVTRQSIAEARLSRSAWKENLSTITSGLIHDFSNVMAGIFSLSELYCSSLDQKHPWHKGMSQIMESSRQARKLVRRIIDLNREVAGAKNYFSLESLLSDQIDLIKAVMPRHTKIETIFTGEELPVYLDDVSFRQTILNLAINSRDAIERDGTIGIRVSKIREGEPLFTEVPESVVPAPKDGAVVEFSDNGCGIPKEILSRIWEPFFTTKEATRGSGFGLYNARLFISQSKGRMAVKSSSGKGTTFFIYLPLADFSETLDLEADEKAIAAAPRSRRSVVILSSGDSSSFDVVQRMREREWELICFRRPEAVRRYLREAPKTPDLFLNILLGADALDSAIFTEMKASHPGMRRALVSCSHCVDATGAAEDGLINLVLEDHGNPDEVAQAIDTFLSDHNLASR
jgi:signal transduction histidine kinase